MSLAFLLHSGLQLVLLRLLTFLFNHMVNIPVSLIFGLGKYFAFSIALIMDIAQLFIYYNVLNNTSLGKRFGWKINSKLFQDYKKPEFLSRFHHSWIYLGITLLAMMPIYLGGIFVAAFTSHILKLKKLRSYLCIGLGSLIGCFIWTLGVWNLVELVITTFHH